MTFIWNKTWDEEQVAEWLPEFETAHAAILAQGEYTYNDSFLGLIPGIAGEWEDRAIYLLQGLKRKREQDVLEAQLLAEGYEQVDALDETTRYGRVVLIPRGRMEGPWAEYDGARLTARDGTPFGVLPKGKRVNGHLVNGRKVLVKHG